MEMQSNRPPRTRAWVKLTTAQGKERSVWKEIARIHRENKKEDGSLKEKWIVSRVDELTEDRLLIVPVDAEDDRAFDEFLAHIAGLEAQGVVVEKEIMRVKKHHHKKAPKGDHEEIDEEHPGERAQNAWG